ncbi:MAG TPA: sulfite exporter TauE/SafE family protein [Gemmatimonadaceae bacterium]|nr:sulfite exporter TauE/SafE family protein [Gemmatimonadaceae bacterium]
MNPLALILAALIGLSLGLLGGGGSILTVPTFVYVLHFEPKTAIAMSLLVVGTTSFVGAVRHWQAGNLRPGIALAFGALSFAGAFAAARLAKYVSGEVQLVVLAVVMLAAAASMLRGARRDTPDTAPARAAVLSPAIILPALGVGMLTGLVGIGGGFLFVPALTLIARLPVKQAIGTSTLVIAINSLGGLAGYGGHVDVPWRFLALFTAVAIAGILAGAQLVRHVPQAALRRAFALFLLIVGSLMLYDRGRRLAQRPGHAVAGHAVAGHADAAALGPRGARRGA